MKRELLGLFRYKYDYHEWEHLQCVSFDRELLVKQHQLIEVGLLKIVRGMLYTRPLLDWSEHDSARDDERTHYCILPVEFLEEDQSVYRGDGLL